MWISSELLPENLREQFGLPSNRVTRSFVKNAARLSRRVHPRLPNRLRFSPYYQAAQERIRLSEAVDRGDM